MCMIIWNLHATIIACGISDLSVNIGFMEKDFYDKLSFSFVHFNKADEKMYSVDLQKFFRSSRISLKIHIKMEKKASEIEEISSYRRIFPQILATFAKNLIIFNLGEFYAFPTLVIPSLIGVCSELNPDENLQITAETSSWLCKISNNLLHPSAKVNFLDSVFLKKINVASMQSIFKNKSRNRHLILFD